MYNWLPVLGLPVQLVACAWLDCLYNWLLRLYRQRKHRQPVIHAAQAQAISYTGSPSTGNQLYKQRKHTQPVIHRGQARATSYTSCPSTCNQLYTQPKHKHRQPVIHPNQAHATLYTPSPSTGNQLHIQRKHRQPVRQAAQTHTSNYTRKLKTN